MDGMTYKGYTARFEYSEEDGCFVGHLAGIRDIVGFDGGSIAEITERFYEAVDGYLAACKKLGQLPNKPCSGRVRLRMSPDVHARACARAAAEGVTLNQWAARALERAALDH